jgi:hypothetical protein
MMLRARTPFRPRRPLVALVLAVLVLAAACGDDDDTSTTPRDDGGGATADLVVQVHVAGGFVTPETALSTVPEVTVLADGTVLTPGVVPAIYPGPAVTPIQKASVDPAEITALVELARSLGLLDGPLEFGQPPIADAPTTTVRIVADGVEHRHDAYALALDPGVGDAGDAPTTPEGAALGADERANREALAQFVAAAQSIGVGDSLWTPDAYAVTVLGPATTPEGEPPQPPVDWPLDAAPDTTGADEGAFPCTVVDGADAATLAAALASANAATPWVVDGAELHLAVRPVLPGDPGCA